MKKHTKGWTFKLGGADKKYTGQTQFGWAKSLRNRPFITMDDGCRWLPIVFNGEVSC
jgi:hypothetical protein